MTPSIYSLFVLGALFCCLLTPLVRHLATKYGFVDCPQRARKVHKEAVPRLGGAAILFSFLLVLLFGGLTVPELRNTLWGDSHVGGVVVLGSLSIFVIGVLDDLSRLSPKVKLLGEFLIDPTGPASGSNRVIRGGSWANGGPSLRSAKRLSHAPSDRVNLGFRLSLRPASKAEPQVQVPEKESVAVSVNAGKAFTIQDLRLEMLWVKAGVFEMGGPQYTRHEVTLTEGYWLGKYEVTQAQWEKIMGFNPSFFKGASRPVEQVSWTRARTFCKKLTEVKRRAGSLPAGMAYQLPTEAQWEYACRAGTTTAYAFGVGLTHDQANIRGGPGETTVVGKYPANAWGFHDMHGNVREWCEDRHGSYPSGSVTDPVGPAGIFYNRVARGGSLLESAYLSRSTHRIGIVPTDGKSTLGFRLSLRKRSSN